MLLLAEYSATSDIHPRNTNGSSVKIGPKELSILKQFSNQAFFHWQDSLQMGGDQTYQVEVEVYSNQSKSGVFSVECPETVVAVILKKHSLPLPHNMTENLPMFILLDGQPDYSNNVTLTPTVSNASLTIDVSGGGSGGINPQDYYVSVYMPVTTRAVQVSGISKTCQYWGTVVARRSPPPAPVAPCVPANASAVRYIEMNRNSSTDVHVVDLINLTDHVMKSRSSKSMTFRWFLHPHADTGGALIVQINVSSSSASSSAMFVGCLTPNAERLFSCDGGGHNLVYSSRAAAAANGRRWSLPYPRAGLWHLDITFSSTGAGDSLRANVSVRTLPCVHECNGPYQGTCYTYLDTEIVYSGCHCDRGWYGLVCQEQRGKSRVRQVFEMLLLTLSNAAFLPCIYVAWQRRLFSPCIVYCLVFLLSTLYHMCDVNSPMQVCMLPYDTLQYGDFTASVSAFWYTLVAVARLPVTWAPPPPQQQLASSLHVLGTFVIAIAVHTDRFSWLTFVLPILAGKLVVGVSFWYQTRVEGSFFPGRPIMLRSVLPGTALGYLGMLCFAGIVNTNNYFVVHSFWHVFAGASVCLLLPDEATAPPKVGTPHYEKGLVLMQRKSQILPPTTITTRFSTISDTGLAAAAVSAAAAKMKEEEPTAQLSYLKVPSTDSAGGNASDQHGVA